MSNRSVTITDWDNIGWANADNLMVKLGERKANASVTYDAPITTAKRKDGSVPNVAVITFDGNVVRDTWVHGWAIDSGYVAFISW
jgi:hypothetical protein